MKIQYYIDGFKDLKIFGDRFVKENNRKCFIIVGGEKKSLTEYLTLKENQKRKKFIEVKLIENKKNTSMNSIFFQCENLKSLKDISKWDTKNITNMSCVFEGCRYLEFLPDISKWNTDNVTDMSYMFKGCEYLESLPDISKWNTKNVTNMEDMFQNCKALKYLPDISKWDTRNVNNMNRVFEECQNLKNLPDISKWDVRNVTDMRNMFYDCNSLKNFPDISNWNIGKNIQMKDIYDNCDSIESLLNFFRDEINKKKVNNKLSEMTIIYDIKNEDEGYLEIFGHEFVFNNINNCYLLIDNEKTELTDILNLNKEQKENSTLIIKLVETKKITKNV